MTVLPRPVIINIRWMYELNEDLYFPCQHSLIFLLFFLCQTYLINYKYSITYKISLGLDSEVLASGHFSSLGFMNSL